MLVVVMECLLPPGGQVWQHWRAERHHGKSAAFFTLTAVLSCCLLRLFAAVAVLVVMLLLLADDDGVRMRFDCWFLWRLFALIAPKPASSESCHCFMKKSL